MPFLAHSSPRRFQKDVQPETAQNGFGGHLTKTAVAVWDGEVMLHEGVQKKRWGGSSQCPMQQQQKNGREKKRKSYKNRNVKEQKLKTTSFKYPLQKKTKHPPPACGAFSPSICRVPKRRRRFCYSCGVGSILRNGACGEMFPLLSCYVFTTDPSSRETMRGDDDDDATRNHTWAASASTSKSADNSPVFFCFCHFKTLSIVNLGAPCVIQAWKFLRKTVISSSTFDKKT